MATVDQYDYTAELDDDKDTLQFGKYRGLTPVEVLDVDPGYIVWAHSKTFHWVGSEEIVKRAHIAKNSKYREREVQTAPERKPNPTVEEFEEAMLETFGEFPKPLWMR